MKVLKTTRYAFVPRNLFAMVGTCIAPSKAHGNSENWLVTSITRDKSRYEFTTVYEWSATPWTSSGYYSIGDGRENYLRSLATRALSKMRLRAMFLFDHLVLSKPIRETLEYIT